MRTLGALLILIAGAFVALTLARLGASAASVGSSSEPSREVAPPETTAELELRFGVYQTDKASTVFESFRPVLDALEEGVSARLGRTVEIDLQISATYEAGRSDLTQGRVDFARFGPASYVLAQDESRGVRLLAMEEKKRKRRFQGLIVTRADSEIETIAQLAGRRFAFGDRRSTIGRYLSQALLVEEGVLASDLGSFEYLGRHDRVFKAVEIGDADAGAVKESTFKKLNTEGQLRVLASFPNVTKPWIARAGLDDEIFHALSESLQAINDKNVLRALRISAFVPAEPDDYEFVRVGMRASESFGSSD
jgi:phosphonate transport system substrate-binding protein